MRYQVFYKQNIYHFQLSYTQSILIINKKTICKDYLIYILSLMLSPQFQSVADQQRGFTLSKTKLFKQTLKQSSERNKKIPLFPSSNQIFQKFIPNCGLIRGEWMEQNKIQSLCYGSGVAISKRVILTCAHSIFHDDKSLLCDKASFIPNHKEGKIKIHEKVYSSSNQNSIKLKVLKKGQKFKKLHISEELALIYLSQDLELDNFPQVGVEEPVDIQEKSSIMICGYPSMSYYRCSDLFEIDFKRAPIYGQLDSIIGSTIFYNLDTKTGHSGSPIFGINSKTGTTTIFGVHTHKGKKTSSGVFLNKTNLKRLARYEIQLGLEHPEYRMGIKLPQTIKRQVWNELCLEQRKKFKERKIYYKLMNKNEEHQGQSNFLDEQYDSQGSQGSDMQDFYKQDINVGMSDFNELLAKNRGLTEKILDYLPYNIYKQVLCQWLLMEKGALSIFRQLIDKSQQRITKSNKICLQTKKKLELDREWLQNQAIYGRSHQIQIFRCKFPPVDIRPSYDLLS